jgi:hypothetical protein
LVGEYVFFIKTGELWRFVGIIQMDEFFAVQRKHFGFIGDQIDAEVAFFIGCFDNDNVFEKVVFE